MKSTIKYFLVFFSFVLLQCCKTFEKSSEISIGNVNWMLSETQINGVTTKYQQKVTENDKHVLLYICKIKKKENMQIFRNVFVNDVLIYKNVLRDGAHRFSYNKIICDENGKKQKISPYKEHRLNSNKEMVKLNDFIMNNKWQIEVKKDTVIIKDDSTKLTFIKYAEFKKIWEENLKNNGKQ